jgi:hypothetical protein
MQDGLTHICSEVSCNQTISTVKKFHSMYNKEQAAPLPDGSVPYGKFKTVQK